MVDVLSEQLVQFGIDRELHDVEWIVGLIDAIPPKAGKRGPYKKASAAS